VHLDRIAANLPGSGRIEAVQVRGQESWGEVGTNLQR
jgi:hypothetical protein